MILSPALRRRWPDGSARRSILLALCAALTLGLADGCERAQMPSGEPDPQPLRLGLPQQPASALVMIALARDLFSAQGLQVIPTRYPSGKRALNDGLLAGAVDLITVADAPVAIAGLEDAPIRVLASVFYADNVNRVVARRDAGITSAVDLAGKTIGTQQGSAVHFFWHLFSLEHDMHDPSRLRFMPAEQLPQALAQGSIDAFVMREPYVSEAQSLLGDNALVLAEPGLYGQQELLVADASTAQERPAAMRRFLKALLEAQNYCLEQPAAARALVARALSVPVAQIDALWPEVHLRVRLEQSLLALLEDQALWYMSAGLAAQRPLPNYLKFIDPDPLSELAPASVTLIR